jgi:hypothetical protein
MTRYTASVPAAILVGGLLMGPGTASARTIPASLGTPPIAGDAACFGMDNSSMTNLCTTRRHLEFPAPVDNFVSKSVTVSGFGRSSASNMGCAAVGVNKQLTPVPGCNNPAAPVFGMVCKDHKDVPKATIKKYREARREATKGGNRGVQLAAAKTRRTGPSRSTRS